MSLTPKQTLKLGMLQEYTNLDVSGLDGEEIDNLYDEQYENISPNEYREGEIYTHLTCEYSRHYESKAVAACISGVWVGWTYWYGGGKHGDPEEIEWMNNAYFLNCVEEEKLVTIRTFSRT